MEAQAQFELCGVLCSIVAEESFRTGSQDPDALKNGTVIGRCRLNGHRYLIVCCTNPVTEVDSDSATAVCQLTRREREVALMVSTGLSNKQIAHQLRLSEWTVSSYLRRVFVKLGVRTRAAMVARLLDG
jgi:DNA-binding CsgD family transcriptional regulator